MTDHDLLVSPYSLVNIDTLDDGFSSLLPTLLKRAGLTFEQLQQASGRIRFDSCVRFLEEGIALTNDELFPLKVAMSNSPFNVGELSSLLQSCATIRDMFNAIAALHSTNSLSHGWLAVEHNDDFYFIRVQSTRIQHTPPSITLHSIATVHRYMSELLGKSFKPNLIGLNNTKMEHFTELEHFFNADINYACRNAFIAFDKRFLDIPMPEANANQQALLSSKLSLAKPKETAFDVVEATTALVHVLLGNSSLTMPMVAKHLKLSPKTLQRHLKRANISFSRLLNEARLETTAQLMRQTHLSLTQISLLVGFSDPSVLSHFVKLHKGISPRVWREQLLSA